jgi:hypothetical protein
MVAKLIKRSKTIKLKEYIFLNLHKNKGNYIKIGEKSDDLYIIVLVLILFVSETSCRQHAFHTLSSLSSRAVR